MHDRQGPRRRPAALGGLPALLAAALLLPGLPGTARAHEAQEAQETQAPRSAAGELAPQQTIRISVGRWDGVEQTYTPWESVGGEFRIPPGGELSLPMVGAVSTLGRTPAELGEAIAEKLRQRMGMGTEVEVGVTITGFAAVYVTGDVKAPGAYDYVPGLTVAQAIGQAGGIDTPASSLLSGDRNALNSMGTYRVLQLELLRRLATRARLRAELNDSEIEVPEELAQAPMGEQLIEQEREIMEAREAAYQSSLSQLDDLEALLQERISRLDRQVELRDEQLALTQEELEKASKLVEEGLSTADNQSSLQRQVADQQVRRLELETARLDAEQQLNETRRDRLDLTNNRQRELVEGLQEQRAKVEELRVRMETEAALYAESLSTGTGLLQMQGDGPARLEVTRTSGEGTRTLSVERGDRLRGGDVLDVTLPGIESGGTVPVERLSGDGVDLPEDISGGLPTEPSGAEGAKAEGSSEAPQDRESSQAGTEAGGGAEAPPSPEASQAGAEAGGLSEAAPDRESSQAEAEADGRSEAPPARESSQAGAEADTPPS